MLETLSARLRDFGLSIGEGAVGLCASLGVMIMVARVSGESGLGVFSYLLSLFYVAGYLSGFGLPGLVEREAAPGETGAGQLAGLADALRAIVFSSFLCSIFFILLAVYGISHTHVEERAAAYLIIGLTIPLRNLNELKLALLQARGSHALASELKIKRRIVFVAAVLLMLAGGIPPSYLVLGFGASELALVMIAWRKVRLPALFWGQALRNGWGRLGQTLRKGFDHFFCDETLEVVFYIDFFVLGLFVSSWTLGVYAEASVLARFFLLIPTSIKPIIRRRYCRLASGNDDSLLPSAMRRSAAVMLFIQLIVGLYFLLYYSDIRRGLFAFHGENLASFQVFTLLLPGLLFFSASTLQEPVYEACERLDLLQKLVVTNSIPQTDEFKSLEFVTVKCLSDTLARTINRIHYNRSVSQVFYRPTA